MIVVQLVGGLGNQMFQYALGRSLAEKNRTKLLLDTAWFDNIENIDTLRRYELDCYPIVGTVTDMKKVKLAEQDNAPKPNTFIKRVLSKTTLSVHAETDASFHAEILDLPNNVYLKGFWQNENYFLGIRGNLLSEFSPKKLSSYTTKVAIRIQKTPSVAIHVRRGDYVNNPITNKFHGLAPIEYYVNSLKFLGTKVGKLQCYIFSDDIKWCKANLPFAKNAVFINGNEPNRACEDMYLMKLCSHNIIANSSFSWWGAWLNENPEKVVVAPKVWFQDKIANAATQIVPKDWFRM